MSANVDVATGNLNLSVGVLSLTGVTTSTGVSLVYNSRAENTTAAAMPARWSLAIGGAATLSQVSSGVLYTGGDGYSVVFTPVAGSTTAFTPPAGVKADLVKNADGTFKLTSRTTAEVTTFDADGKTVGLADRNGNKAVVGYASGRPSSVTSTAGPVAARTGTFTYDSQGVLESIKQTSGVTRTATIGLDPYEGLLAQFVDPAGKTTSFSYVNKRISSVVTPTGARTNFTYDTAGKLTKIERVNTSAGSPGNSVTRIAYPSATQTLVAGPNTDQTAAITAVPRTTYTIAANKTVTAATDPMGRAQSTTYTGDFDTLTATQGTGTTAGTTTNTYGSNTGQSLTASQSAGGATGAAEYANTAASTKYLASSTTDDSGNKSLYTYNGAGNALTSSDALAAEAKLTYNLPDGTVATALAPGNGTNTTKYTYDGVTKQLITTTPVAGSSLGVRNFTYDAFGQPKTATNGRGVTLTYTYDVLGRLTSTAFSDGTPTVSYTYNDNGQTLTRVDGQGTTTYGYDQMGRLTSRANTAGGGTISYGYDKASNLTSTTDSRGTTTYKFDASGTPTELVYLNEGIPQTLAFATDDRGRRTDTWLQASPSRATWAAHTKTEYDKTGRVTRVTGEQGSGNTDNTPVMDLSYCYSAGSTAPTCPTTAAQDRSKIQWVKDNLTGAVTAYTYDGAGRLTKAVVTGGPAPTTYTYTYDARGNRLTSSGGTTPATNLTFNAANQITTAGYTFDGTGNITAAPGQTFTYNGADQMITSGKNGTQYTKTYAGTSQNEMLTQKTVSDGNYSFTYGRTDAQGLPIIEQVHRGTDTAYVEHDPVTGAPLILRTSSGLASLYIFDGTGNPAALITSGAYTAFAYTYDPYGVPTLTKDSGGNGKTQNPYTFKQGLQDRSTGWVKYGARWYDSITGRWTQQDTLDAPLDPLNANRYAFAANDPINNSDPLGLAYGGVGLDICAFACITLGFGGDGDVDFSLGFAVGPSIGIDGSLGGGIGSNEGTSWDTTCGGSLGPIGGYGEFSVGEGGVASGGAGIQGGLSLGCSSGITYTW